MRLAVKNLVQSYNIFNSVLIQHFRRISPRDRDCNYIVFVFHASVGHIFSGSVWAKLSQTREL